MARHSLVLRWQELPTRVIRAKRQRSFWFAQRPAFLPAPSGRAVGGEGPPTQEPFNFCVNIQRLVMDIAIRCPDFAHLQVPRILVSVTQARGGQMHGLQARVTPLRFANGALVRKRRGVPYHIQRFFLAEHEFLYLMTFCLPRFLDQDFDQKLVTLFHELYHIGPAFDGDLRRHDGRYHYHSHSQCDYDKRMVEYAREYLAAKPDSSIHAFLRLDFGQLQERHGAVTGVVVPRPKMIPIAGQSA